jgi:hypothetical protein
MRAALSSAPHEETQLLVTTPVSGPDRRVADGIATVDQPLLGRRFKLLSVLATWLLQAALTWRFAHVGRRL